MVNKSGTGQYIVSFSKPIIIPAHYVSIPFPGSMAILEATAVKLF